MPPQVDWKELILLIAGLLAIIVVGVTILVVLRHRAQDLRQAASPEPFTLEQLRQLYSQGQLTEAEFQRAKAKIIERMRSRLESPPPPHKPGGQMGEPGAGTSSS